MITFNDFRKTGCITKYFGNKNEFFIRFIEKYPLFNEDALDHVFIQIDGYLVPFGIDSLRLADNGMYVEFTDFDINNEKTSLINRDVFFHLDALLNEENDFSFKNLTGYCLFNNLKLKIGIIIDYIDIKDNPNLLVNYNNQEIMIPFHKDLILFVDHDKKNIFMEIPDGLLNIE